MSEKTILVEDSISKNHHFKIVSYNVLSPNLAKPSWFAFTEPEHLNNDTRFNKLISKIEEYCEQNYIICLQELSEEWEMKLHPIFNSLFYTLISARYGYAGNGFMGVAIAFPNNYSLIESKTFMVGSSIVNMYEKPELTTFEKALSYVPFSKYLYNFNKTTDYHTVNEARNRDNRMLSLKLSLEENYNIWIHNYHMPFAFMKPIIMNEHARAVMNIISTNCDNSDIFLVGDFNSQPVSKAYSIITENMIDYYADKRFNTCMTKSLFKGNLNEFRGYIDYIFKGNINEFRGCIDYIFYAPNSDNLLNVDEDFKNEQHELNSLIDDNLPNETHSSDHLPLIASFYRKC